MKPIEIGCQVVIIGGDPRVAPNNVGKVCTVIDITILDDMLVYKIERPEADLMGIDMFSGDITFCQDKLWSLREHIMRINDDEEFIHGSIRQGEYV